MTGGAFAFAKIHLKGAGRTNGGMCGLASSLAAAFLDGLFEHSSMACSLCPRPVIQGYSRYGYKIKGEQKSAYVYGIDPYYIPTLDLKIVQGRNFDLARASDSLGVPKACETPV